MTLFHCYYQWKITMVTQQCDEATGGKVWQRGSVKHRCVTSVYAHTEPRCLAITRESSRVIRTDPLRDVKTGHSPLRHAKRARIIVAPLGCEIQRADESLWDSKWRKGFSLPRWSRGMRGTSSPTGSSENGFIFTLLSWLSVWSVAFTAGYPSSAGEFPSFQHRLKNNIGLKSV